MYKVRVGYTVHLDEPSDVDAINAALTEVPDDARHLRMEVVSHWNEIEVPIEEEKPHENQ